MPAFVGGLSANQPAQSALRARECAENRRSRTNGKSDRECSVKIQRLSNLACRASPAIGNYVRGHGRAMFPVTPVNFLNDALAPVATRQIKINVRPAFTALV